MKKPIRRCLTILTIIISAFFSNAASLQEAKPSWNEKHLTEPMFEILGLLGEYISRFSPYTGVPMPDLIERFYPNEIEKADRLEALLGEHAVITGLKKDWRREIGKQGHVWLYSQAWSAIVNSFYVKVEKKTATLDAGIFDRATQAEMLRFLRGAYARYGSKDKGSTILMANAPYKVTTISLVLKKLGCTAIAIYRTYRMPNLFQAHFNPSPAVKEFLGIERTVLMPESDLSGWSVFAKID